MSFEKVGVLCKDFLSAAYTGLSVREGGHLLNLISLCQDVSGSFHRV